MKETKKGLEVTEMLRYVDYKKYLDGQLFFSSKIHIWIIVFRKKNRNFGLPIMDWNLELFPPS